MFTTWLTEPWLSISHRHLTEQVDPRGSDPAGLGQSPGIIPNEPSAGTDAAGLQSVLRETPTRTSDLHFIWQVGLKPRAHGWSQLECSVTQEPVVPKLVKGWGLGAALLRV